MNQYHDIEHLLQECQTIAVVGLSPKASRESHVVASYLQAQGRRIIAVNPNASEVLGEKAWPSLREAAQHEKIDLVNVFRNREEVPPLAEEAVAIGARGLWLQKGIVHAAAAAKARAAGLRVVQDACLMVEHKRWLR
jgi:uncharacterized protein